MYNPGTNSPCVNFKSSGACSTARPAQSRGKNACCIRRGCMRTDAQDYDAAANRMCDWELNDAAARGSPGHETAFQSLASAGCPQRGKGQCGAVDAATRGQGHGRARPVGTACCSVAGCTSLNANAVNVNPEANYDNGSCVVVGCTDPRAQNYDPEATKLAPRKSALRCELASVARPQKKQVTIPRAADLRKTVERKAAREKILSKKTAHKAQAAAKRTQVEASRTALKQRLEEVKAKLPPAPKTDFKRARLKSASRAAEVKAKVEKTKLDAMERRRESVDKRAAFLEQRTATLGAQEAKARTSKAAAEKRRQAAVARKDEVVAKRQAAASDLVAKKAKKEKVAAEKPQERTLGGKRVADKELRTSHIKHQDSAAVAEAAERTASAKEAMKRRLEDATTAKVAGAEIELKVYEKQETRYKETKEKRTTQHAKAATAGSTLLSKKAEQAQKVATSETKKAAADATLNAHKASLPAK